ncbi:MAG: hypothetical protein U1F29_02385 [Planctomycetota bacterium]
MKVPSDALRVEITLRTTVEGGRQGPLNLRDTHYPVLAACGTFARWSDELDDAADPKLFGIVLAQGPPLVWPGESAVAVAFSTLFEPGTERLAQAGTFTLFEGRRIVGRGRVLGRLRDGA